MDGTERRTSAPDQGEPWRRWRQSQCAALDRARLATFLRQAMRLLVLIDTREELYFQHHNGVISRGCLLPASPIFSMQ